MDLVKAIKDNSFHAVKELITNGVCIYTPDSDLSTPLHHALLIRNKEVIDLILQGYERDFNVLKRNAEWIGNQPVYVAVTEDQISQVRNIAESSAVSSSAPGVHESLEAVLLYNYINPEVVLVKFTDRDLMLKQSLLKNGCFNVNAINNDSVNYLFAAATYRLVETFKRLRKLNADYTIRVANNTCLHIAALRGCLEIVEDLLEIENLDLDSKGAQDATPLLQAARSGNVEVFDAILNKITQNKNDDEVVRNIVLRDHLEYVEVMQYSILHGSDTMVKRLLDFGVDPEIKSIISGCSSVLWAVECCNSFAVKLFISSGINLENSESIVIEAMEIAKRRGYKDMIKTLEEAAENKIFNTGRI